VELSTVNMVTTLQPEQLKNHDSTPGTSKRFSSSPKCSDQLFVWAIILFNEYWRLFPWR